MSAPWSAPEPTLDEGKIALLRKPFAEVTVGKLPRTTCGRCAKNERKRCDDHQWIANCAECHGSHTSATIHLDYVGHAAVTDRLLAVDPFWSWEPMVLDGAGFPGLDRDGNLWIRLTVGGMTRLGVGDGRNAKERIGDAIRNAAMRFGVALDLWSKDELETIAVGAAQLRSAVAAELASRQPGQDAKPEPEPEEAPPPAEPEPSDPAADGRETAAVGSEPDPGATAPESPLLNTSGKLARRMFALMGDAGKIRYQEVIYDLKAKDDRLAYVSVILGRTVESSKEMTDADAERVIDALERLLNGDPS